MRDDYNLHICFIVEPKEGQEVDKGKIFQFIGDNAVASFVEMVNEQTNCSVFRLTDSYIVIPEAFKEKFSKGLYKKVGRETYE